MKFFAKILKRWERETITRFARHWGDILFVFSRCFLLHGKKSRVQPFRKWSVDIAKCRILRTVLLLFLLLLLLFFVFHHVFQTYISNKYLEGWSFAPILMNTFLTKGTQNKNKSWRLLDNNQNKNSINRAYVKRFDRMRGEDKNWNPRVFSRKTGLPHFEEDIRLIWSCNRRCNVSLYVLSCNRYGNVPCLCWCSLLVVVLSGNIEAQCQSAGHSCSQSASKVFLGMRHLFQGPTFKSMNKMITH